MQFFALSKPDNRRFFHKIITALTLSLALASPSAFAVSGGGGGGGGIADGKANYFKLEPAFVVNIMDGSTLRFMQLELDLMTMDSEAIQAVQDHHAPIRHELIMLFAHRDISEVLGVQQREKLRHEALAVVQHVLEKYAHIDSNSQAETGDGHKYPTGIQEVLFTSYVIQ